MNDEARLNEAVASDEVPAATPSGLRKTIKIIAVVGVLAALLVLGKMASPALTRFAGWVEGIGFWGPIVFIVFYALATMALFPGSILTFAAGVIFGLVRGTFYVFIAATLGACGAFLIARYLARGIVEKRLQKRPKFAAIDRAIASRGLRITMLLRLSPIFPFNFINYGLGLTRVSFRDYALASVGMIPGTVLYVYYGAAAGTLAAIGGEDQRQRGPWDYVLMGFGLVVTIAVTVWVTRLARRALKEATGDDDDGADPPAG